MNKLFSVVAKWWNKLFLSFTITPERRTFGSTSWTRYHIHRKRLGRKPQYLGYRLHLAAAIQAAANASGGNGKINIARGEK